MQLAQNKSSVGSGLKLTFQRGSAGILNVKIKILLLRHLSTLAQIVYVYAYCLPKSISRAYDVPYET